MKLSTKIILPIILISALLILLNGCFGVPTDESPGFTPGTISGIIAAPCCLTSVETVSETCCIAPEYWCYYCQKEWKLQDSVEVVLTYGEDEVATTTTNDKGEFTFVNVPPGKNYVITAYCPDYDDDRPLVKDVALELIEGGSFDTKITDLVSTSLGLVVDFLVTYTEWGPEDISLDEVIANKPNFYAFPRFKKLILEVRRVLEECGNVDIDEDVQDALCRAAEEISKLDIGCGPGYTPPPPPPPNPCAGNNAPVIDEVTLNGTAISSPSTQDLVIGTSYTVVINASDDNILTKPANPLTYSLTITKGTDPSFNIDMGTNNTFTGTPLAADVGTYTVYVNVNDGCATTTWGPVTVEVHDECYDNTAPSLTMPDNASVDPGASYSWSVTASDDGIKEPLSFSLVSVVPTPTNNFSVDPTSGEISWNPTCDDIVGGADTTYTITIEVDDGCTTVQGSFEVTLLAEQCDPCYDNTAPSLTMPDNASVDPGASYSWSVTASDDGIKEPLSFSLVSVVPTPTNNFSVDPTSGEISWNPTCDDIVGGADTTYTITIEVDDGCTTVQGSFEVTLLAEQCPGVVEGKICQHNGNGYGQAWAHFRNIETDVVYNSQGAPGSGNYSIELPAGDYVLWADKPTGSQCPTSIGYDTSGGNSIQDPNGWICLTVSSGGMHYYDIWVDNSEGSHPGPCLQPPSDACK